MILDNINQYLTIWDIINQYLTISSNITNYLAISSGLCCSETFWIINSRLLTDRPTWASYRGAFAPKNINTHLAAHYICFQWFEYCWSLYFVSSTDKSQLDLELNDYTPLAIFSIVVFDRTILYNISEYWSISDTNV